MVDTRCYKCSKDKIQNFESPDYIPLPIRKYQGNGIFKCPKCGDILDISKNTYKTKISRVYDENGELYTKILELDPKLSKDEKICFRDDILETDLFENFPIGKYEIEILWYYYKCGVYDEEWDLKLEILSKKELR